MKKTEKEVKNKKSTKVVKEDKNKKVSKTTNSKNKKKTKEKYSSSETFFLCGMFTLLGILLGVTFCYCRVNFLDNSDTKLREIISTYNSIVKNSVSKVDKDELADAAISGMVNSLDDPYSNFLDKKETKSFNDNLSGYYEGIGITIMQDEKTKQIKVLNVMDNSPAEKAGILKDDILVSIDNKIATKGNASDLADYISKCKDKTITIKVNRNNKELTYKLKRDKVEMSSVESTTYDDIGYININNFALNTGKQFNKQLGKLKKMNIKSLIIDVRNNPGGHLGQVQTIAEPFFKSNTVLYKVDTGTNIQKVKTTKRDKMNIPVVILINENSASASEILAAAFKDNYKKATLVGKNTYGKGTIQKEVKLSSGSSIKYTTQKWLTPKGEWFDHDSNKSLKPDVEVDYCQDEKCLEDMQLERAKEILKKSS